MESATISSRTLDIDGMSGDACVQKVTSALKGVPGVSTQSVKVGTATIKADQAGFDAACAAIGSAGHKAREGARAGETNGSPRASSDNPSGQKGAGQSCTAPQNAASDNKGAANSGSHKGADGPNQNASAKPAATTA